MQEAEVDDEDGAAAGAGPEVRTGADADGGAGARDDGLHPQARHVARSCPAPEAVWPSCQLACRLRCEDRYIAPVLLEPASLGGA